VITFYAASSIFLILWLYEKNKVQKAQKQIFELSLQLKVLETENKNLQEMEKTFKLLSQEALERTQIIS
jgi:hypothetical protein